MKMKSQSIILSLIYPVIAAIAAITAFFLCGISDNGINAIGFALITAFLVGGVLPVILITAGKIDLSGYFKHRIIAFVIGVVTALLSSFVALFINPMFCIFMFFPVIIEALHFFPRVKNIKEWIVLILSNPLIYYIVVFMIFYCNLWNAKL
ncbi:MAG: hypothetical protein J6D27_01965 [Ruminiclostridium sp.]|nr:hypothetical protein [Ruminiclostridium sp.]